MIERGPDAAAATLICDPQAEVGGCTAERMVAVFTGGRGGGRRPPEVLVDRGATAHTVREAQRRLRGEIRRVG